MYKAQKNKNVNEMNLTEKDVHEKGGGRGDLQLKLPGSLTRQVSLDGALPRSWNKLNARVKKKKTSIQAMAGKMQPGGIFSQAQY